eukprot:g1728.t1
MSAKKPKWIEETWSDTDSDLGLDDVDSTTTTTKVDGDGEEKEEGNLENFVVADDFVEFYDEEDFQTSTSSDEEIIKRKKLKKKKKKAKKKKKKKKRKRLRRKKKELDENSFSEDEDIDKSLVILDNSSLDELNDKLGTLTIQEDEVVKEKKSKTATPRPKTKVHDLNMKTIDDTGSGVTNNDEYQEKKDESNNEFLLTEEYGALTDLQLINDSEVDHDEGCSEIHDERCSENHDEIHDERSSHDSNSDLHEEYGCLADMTLVPDSILVPEDSSINSPTLRSNAFDEIPKVLSMEMILGEKTWNRLYPHQQNGLQWMWNSLKLGNAQQQQQNEEEHLSSSSSSYCAATSSDDEDQKITQLEGIGSVLADDMGLGKTVQVCALFKSILRYPKVLRKKTREMRDDLRRRNRRPQQEPAITIGSSSILLILPLTLVDNWQSELSKWCPGFTKGNSGFTFLFLSAQTKARRRQALQMVRQFHGTENLLLITTYEMILRHTDDLDLEWDLIVLDEAHRIKNLQTQIAQAVRRIESKRRLLLTGTPIQNHLRELWNLLDYACEGCLLGDLTNFEERFEEPIVRGSQKDATPKEQVLATQLTKQLRKLCEPHILRRTKKMIVAQEHDQDDGQQELETHHQQQQLMEGEYEGGVASPNDENGESQSHGNGKSQSHGNGKSQSDGNGKSQSDGNGKSQSHVEHKSDSTPKNNVISQKKKRKAFVLPPKEDVILWTVLSPIQRFLYQSFLESPDLIKQVTKKKSGIYRTSNENAQAFNNALTKGRSSSQDQNRRPTKTSNSNKPSLFLMLTRLRQLCNHPLLLRSGVEERRITNNPEEEQISDEKQISQVSKEVALCSPVGKSNSSEQFGCLSPPPPAPIPYRSVSLSQHPSTPSLSRQLSDLIFEHETINSASGKKKKKKQNRPSTATKDEVPEGGIHVQEKDSVISLEGRELTCSAHEVNSFSLE